MRYDLDGRFHIVMAIWVVILVGGFVYAAANAHKPHTNPNVEHKQSPQSFSSDD